MRALLDVNVLIALLDSAHVLHGRALEWYSKHARLGWASCPITQNGCVRVMSSPSYANSRHIGEVARRLADACENPLHEFWSDDVSVLDQKIVDTSRVHSAQRLTDVYLLALATLRGGRLVTLDSGITIDAVHSASAHNLLLI